MQVEPDRRTAVLRTMIRARVFEQSLGEEFAKQHSNVYALAEWHEEYSASAKEFLATYVPKLLQMAGGTKGLDDVRIVFFFDN